MRVYSMYVKNNSAIVQILNDSTEGVADRAVRAKSLCQTSKTKTNGWVAANSKETTK